MNGLLILTGGFVASALAVEFGVRRKLQSALGAVLAVHAAGFVVAAWLADVGATAAVVFWSGMFVCWFGIRCHVESSILLRMVYLLRHGPLTGADLVRRYARHYGEAARLEELERGGLMTKTSDRSPLTPKGHAIVRIATFFRRWFGAAATAGRSSARDAV
jgi:hypothetical protein